MKNEHGVTLVELLVTIAIMGAVFIPISMMVNYSLQTEKDVAVKNDVQREARIIMENITDKMRNKNVYWKEEGVIKELIKCNVSISSDRECSDPAETYFVYDHTQSKITTGEGAILSEHASLTITPINSSGIKGELIQLKIEKGNETVHLESVIGSERFKNEDNSIQSTEENNRDESEPEQDSSENEKDQEKDCPPGHIKNGKC